MIMSTVAFAEGTDFSDIPDDAWYKEYVSALTSKGIMTGYDNKNFGPDDICTRAQFVTLLYRGAGEPEVTADTSFADVNPDEYYADAVVWAKEASITNGYEDGNFGVDDMLTRSHVVAFIYRYVDYVNGNLSLKADLSSYADANLIEDYAKEPFSWAIANKIVLGTSDSTLEPNTLASRWRNEKVVTIKPRRRRRGF